MYKFQCPNCSSNEMQYEKWINSRQDVAIQPDGRIKNGPLLLDEENFLGAPYGYVCKKCGHNLHIGPWEVQTDEDLRHYLAIDPEVIRAENELYYQELQESEGEIDDWDFEEVMHEETEV